MKRIILVIITAMTLFTACGGYNHPAASELAELIISSQGLEEMSEASGEDIEILFKTEASELKQYCVKYSSRGAYADMVAILEAGDGKVGELEKLLSDYKNARYEDFKGYAPLEAEKVENGKVLVYDSYVILLIVPDVQSAEETVDSEFTK